MSPHFRAILRTCVYVFCAASLVFAHSTSVLAETIFLPLVQGEQPVADGQVMVAAASAPSALTTVIVHLAPEANPNQLAADYQATVVSSIPTLAFYRLQGAAPDLLTRLASDSRVVAAQDDKLTVGFEARKHSFDATGSTFEYLQRFFGFGSGDSDTDDGEFNVDKDAKKPKKGDAKKGKPKDTEQVLIVNGQKLDEKWQIWGLHDSRLDKMLDKSTGAGVIVAVLDTGVDLNHPMLAGRLLPGYDFVDNDNQPDDAPNGIDDDEDGQVDEGVGHGTHITGIITAGAPGAKVLPVRVLNSDGGGSLFDILRGIDFAVSHGARVINFSLSADEDSPLLATAIQYAQAHGLVIVAAAAGAADYLEYPAAYDGVIAVGAVRQDHTVTDFSTPYAELVDVFAPGELIYSTYFGDAYAWWTGTSMAAPFVSAEAALLLEVNGADQCVPGCIFDFVTGQVESVKPKTRGNGRMNVEKAVNKAAEAIKKAAEDMKKAAKDAADTAAKAAKDAAKDAKDAADIAAKAAKEKAKGAQDAAKDAAQAAKAAEQAAQAADTAAQAAKAAEDAAKPGDAAAKGAAAVAAQAAQDAAAVAVKAAQDAAVAAAKAAQDAAKQ